MVFDYEKACKELGFSEENLLKTADILINAKKKRNNIFYENHIPCDYDLPEGMVVGSKEHANYLLITTILDIGVESKVIHEKYKQLYAKKPEFFDPKYIFEIDKGKQRISKNGQRDKERDSVVDRRSRVLVAPKLAKIIKEELEHGFRAMLSGSLHQSARKLNYYYDGDTRKIFSHVKDPDVIYRRLDMNRSNPSLNSRKNYTSKMIFSGLGRKTAPLLLFKAIRSGIANDIDRTNVISPFDRHMHKLCVSRKIINLPPGGMRKDMIVKLAQPLFRRTFSSNSVDAVEFHESQWLLASEACTYADCKTRTLNVREEKQRICPFENPCKVFMDTEMYRSDGIVKPTKLKLY